MPRAKHPCAEAGCPTPVPHGTSRCPTHTRDRDRARGTTKARGYTGQHRTTRDALTPLHQAGALTCWRCGEPIAPNEPMDLGHDDHDRTITRGPEHANDCNRSAAGRSSHGLAPR